MSEPGVRPTRVRVTGPPRHVGGRPTRSRIGDVHEQTELGDLILQSLLREQFALAARALAIVTVTLGVLPLIFFIWPDLSEQTVVGVPVAWLLLGVLAYPLLVALAWRYVRRAERNELVFADLLDMEGLDPPVAPEPPEKR